jgi:hypothetical protein
MKSSDLFSHPEKPEFVSNTERSTEPVQAPTFSDLSGIDTPTTS